MFDFITNTDWSYHHQLWGSRLEFWGVVTGILSVLLLLFTRQEKIQWFNWPNGVVTSAIYLYLFYKWGLYGNMSIQPLFVIISLHGCYYWRSQIIGHGKAPDVVTKWASDRLVFLMIILAGVLTFASLPLLRHYGDPQPIFDGLLFGIQASGITLQLMKKVQSWFFWIATDIIGVPFHYHNGHHATSGLYFVYLLMSLVGLWTWWKDAGSYAGISGEREDNLLTAMDIPKPIP